MKNIYLDNAATTPVDPRVVEKMLPYLNEYFGNPSSIHSYGRKARVAIEEAREVIAEFINCKPGEIYFTSSGTEANNFALSGISKTEFIESGRKSIITSLSEHHSVLETCDKLSTEGFTVRKSTIDKNTSVPVGNITGLIDDDTSLISIIHVNNETGIINNIEELSSQKPENIFLHTDGVQSFGKIKTDVKELGVDAFTASAHKIRGPKGVGFAFVKSGTPISPLIFGGAQERNRRGGTENVPAIVGFAEAVKIASDEMQSNYEYVKSLQKRFLDGLNSLNDKSFIINGEPLYFPYIVSVTLLSEYYNNDIEAVLMFLDINGVAVSSGAACTSGTLKPSHVLLNAGLKYEDAAGTIRFSFGTQNTPEEIDYTLEIIKKLLHKFRK
ncbi:aminotransferase, class V [Melioribacter roseus P3M-2]|uniref:cysteine desulfurase n=1 Tax=Melioribacter roseus (strain DSM 23840 / JCM 17771 / VKM B-2668 / P3M-2) TaxID=1191523 RepID=I6Z920_MELRP|nr:cysteine desulfurase family protein [Melioribacter roseus]AFN75645.1 aminotransferase, class V [Melioribacter roseus P3M-2]